MNLTDFTSYDEIRAVLGVSSKELEDVTLALPLYSRTLGFELSDMADDLPGVYATVSALPAADRTVAQQRFYDVTQLYSAYSVSRQLLTSLPLFSPQRLTDGRAGFDRHDDPFEDVRAGILEGVHQHRDRMLALYAAITSTAVGTTTIVAPSLTRATGLAIDPVTGRRPV